VKGRVNGTNDPNSEESQILCSQLSLDIHPLDELFSLLTIVERFMIFTYDSEIS